MTGPHARVRDVGSPKRDLLHPRLERLDEAIVDALVDNDARACGAFLSAESEGRLRSSLNGSIKVAASESTTIESLPPISRTVRLIHNWPDCCVAAV